MKPFTYLTPTEASDAVGMLGAHGSDARVIAGGQTLLLAMKTRAERPLVLVSLAGVGELRGTRFDHTGELVVGATTTYAELARNALPGWHAEIGALAGNLADRPVRTMGTIGGALCAAEPRFDMPALVTGVGARLEVLSPDGVRLLEPAEFFNPGGGTTLRPTDLLIAVRFPGVESFTAVSFEKFRQRTFDAASASALCALRTDADGTVTDARITIGAVTPVPVTLEEVATQLVGRSMSDLAPAEVGDAVAENVRSNHLSDSPTARFQTELVKFVTRTALARACTDSRS